MDSSALSSWDRWIKDAGISDVGAITLQYEIIQPAISRAQMLSVVRGAFETSKGWFREREPLPPTPSGWFDYEYSIRYAAGGWMRASARYVDRTEENSPGFYILFRMNAMGRFDQFAHGTNETIEWIVKELDAHIRNRLASDGYIVRYERC